MLVNCTKILRRYTPSLCRSIYQREEFEYLALKYAMKGKYIHFGPDIDYPETWEMPFHPGDHKVMNVRDFMPYAVVWGIHSRFWWRSFIKLEKDPSKCIPITFLLDTASPAEVFLSSYTEEALNEHGLLTRKSAFEAADYAGTLINDRWRDVHAYRTPSKTGQGRFNILGGKLIAESGGIKVDPESKSIFFMLREAPPKPMIES